jgi:hypothetical protein
MIGANLPKFTDAELLDGMMKRIVSCESDKARNIQHIKDIKVCLTIMASRDIYSGEIKARAEKLLADRTAEVKARYELNGWAFKE